MTKNNDKIEPRKCPGCQKYQNLGNSYITRDGYLCIDCIKNNNIKMKVLPEEKEIHCPFCSASLTVDNLFISPTILLCKECERKISRFLTHKEFKEVQKTNDAIPKYPYAVTIGFVILLLVVYIISTFPNFTKINYFFLLWGGMIPVVLDSSEYWRLITANLLHANLMHIAANTVSILIWGHLLEKYLGSRGMIILIILSGLFTTVFSGLFSPVDSFSIGASGIAYGLMTAFMVYAFVITLLGNPKEFGGQLVSFSVLVIIQIFYNLQGAGTLDIWGHLGGSVSGLLFMIVYFLIKIPVYLKTRKLPREL